MKFRHLFWELVLVVERSTQAVLHWSKWRRWHQAWASYYHTRRRERTRVDWTAQQRDVQQEATHEGEVQQPDVMDVVWKRLERLLPADGRGGRPYEHERQFVLEAIVYVMQTNCGWQHMPSEFPPWQTVYAQYARWRKTGIWDTIWSGFNKPCSASELQL